MSMNDNVGHIFQHFNYFFLLRIAEEGSVLEMRLWTILLIKTDLKWLHLSRRLFSISLWYIYHQIYSTSEDFTVPNIKILYKYVVFIKWS